ncbi:MAG: hypothetical protein ACREVG_17330 [Burkholderiales bacterium]
MKRRELLLAVGALLAAPPAWAQPAAGTHRIGTLSGGSSPKAKDQLN